MNENQEPNTIVVAPAAIKDQASLVKEVDNFARVLLETANLFADAEDDGESLIMTFSRESMESMALTLFQLTSLVQGNKGPKN